MADAARLLPHPGCLAGRRPRPPSHREGDQGCLRRRVGELGYDDGYSYDHSPICIPDGTATPPDSLIDYDQTARPGARAPHAWLTDGRSTLDLFGEGFTLLQFDQTASAALPLLEAAHRKGVPLSLVLVDQPEVAALYEMTFVLVRPDGHVAWRNEVLPHDVDGLLDTVRGESV